MAGFPCPPQCAIWEDYQFKAPRMEFHCVVNSVFRLVLEERERLKIIVDRGRGSYQLLRAQERRIIWWKVDHTARSVSLQGSPRGCHVDHYNGQNVPFTLEKGLSGLALPACRHHLASLGNCSCTSPNTQDSSLLASVWPGLSALSLRRWGPSTLQGRLRPLSHTLLML